MGRVDLRFAGGSIDQVRKTAPGTSLTWTIRLPAEGREPAGPSSCADL